MHAPDPSTSAVGRAILDASTSRAELPATVTDATWSPARIRSELLAQADRFETIALQMSFHAATGAPWADARNELCSGADWCRHRAQMICSDPS